jgi:hypothetical protein
MTSKRLSKEEAEGLRLPPGYKLTRIKSWWEVQLLGDTTPKLLTILNTPEDRLANLVKSVANGEVHGSVLDKCWAVYENQYSKNK